MKHLSAKYLPAKQLSAARLEAYQTLLRRYHKTLDLMSEKAMERLELKLQEAQVYADFLAPRLSPADRLLDVGSGAGLPGVLLALAFPEHEVTWVERRQRRASFLRIVRSQLELENVQLVHGDVRDLRAPEFSWICAQAVGSFPYLYCLTRQLHADRVTLLSRRAAVSPDEISNLEQVAGKHHSLESLPMPTHGTLVAVRVQGGHACPSSV